MEGSVSLRWGQLTQLYRLANGLSYAYTLKFRVWGFGCADGQVSVASLFKTLGKQHAAMPPGGTLLQASKDLGFTV